MKEYKFDRFYYSEDESNDHYLSEIEDLSDDIFVTLYKGKMYCPLCKGPQLTLVRKEKSSFLRTYPNQRHVEVDSDMCPYECEAASKTVMERYIQELREKNKIESVLEAVLRKLLKQSPSDKVIASEKGSHAKNPLLIERIQSDKTIMKNVIPHYSFKSWGKNIPKDQLLIVYGKVYVGLKEKSMINKEGEKINQVYIHFKDIYSKKLITSCIKPLRVEITEGEYYVAILGKCFTNKSKGYIYYNLKVNSPTRQSIVFKRCSD